ncbi:MAG TPA: KpsF/GutQ family sugar-phosphate isomerase [Gemmatimonadaceae bacterium]|jgi:arabinose-5-phosphate isomerase|nr:KpsF/GutQ family sugar-phosphate isomerase [Gemmatimonadaceae bacterium]
MSDANRILDRGRRVLKSEREALAALEARLDGTFVRAVELIAAARGRVLVVGVGKSGLIAAKIAATLTSTGTAATFLHPVDGLHGDLGLVGADDVAILISKSGESAELLALLDHLLRWGVAIVAVVGNPSSTIARHANIVLDASVDEEACPNGLAPTTSTTAALALGDALAVALLEDKGFSAEDFARIHPGGALGRKLLTRVSDVMERDALPTLPTTATMRDAVVLLAERRGTVIVIDDSCHVAGVVTAGDLTRLMEREIDPFPVPVTAVMTRSPKTTRVDDFGSAAVHRMQRHGVMALPVLDDTDQVVGIVHLHDLLRAGCG